MVGVQVWGTPNVQWSVLENDTPKVASLFLQVPVFLLLVRAQVRDWWEGTRRPLS